MSSLYRSESGAQMIAQRYRELLEHWPKPNRQFHVPTRHGETFVVSCGADDAPPLLLLHGAGSNSAMWISDAAAWVNRFKLYAVDVIGEPGFSADSRPPLSSDAYALWLNDVLRALRVERFSMVGISLGGWLALDYATRQPAQVERLVLLVPAGVGRQRWAAMLEILPLLMMGDWGRKRAMQIVIGPGSADSTDGREIYMDFMALVQRHFRSRMEQLPIFSDAALARLTMPLLAVLGGRDVLLDSAETKARLERNVARVEVRYLPDLGHGVFGERAAILEFLSRPGAVT